MPWPLKCTVCSHCCTSVRACVCDKNSNYVISCSCRCLIHPTLRWQEKRDEWMAVVHRWVFFKPGWLGTSSFVCFVGQHHCHRWAALKALSIRENIDKNGNPPTRCSDVCTEVTCPIDCSGLQDLETCNHKKNVFFICTFLCLAQVEVILSFWIEWVINRWSVQIRSLPNTYLPILWDLRVQCKEIQLVYYCGCVDTKGIIAIIKPLMRSWLDFLGGFQSETFKLSLLNPMKN